MNIQDYSALVEETRNAQKDYFRLTIIARKNKSMYPGVRRAMAKAKELEVRLDEATAHIKKAFS